MGKSAKRISKKSFSFSLRSVDLIGEEFSFEFPTFSRKLKTRVGSCLTAALGAICLLVTVLIGSKYFDTSSPTVTFSNEIGPEIMHNLAKELMIPPITVYLEGAPLQADISSYVTARVESIAFAFNRETNERSVLSYMVSDFVDCKELNDPYYNKILSKIDDKNRFKNILKCPDFKGNYSLAEVIEGGSSLNFKYVIPRLYPCSRADPSECISPASVSRLKVVLAQTKKAVVPSNYTHPYKIEVTMEEMRINPLRQRERKYQSKVTKIVDLRNELFQETEMNQFLSTSVLSENNLLRFGAPTTCPRSLNPLLFSRTCQDYISLFLRGGSEVVRVKRLYNSPTQIIGEIGGVLKVALMVVMVYAIYNNMIKRTFVKERVFSQEKVEGKHKEGVGAFGKLAKRGRIEDLPQSLGAGGSSFQHSKVVE